MVGGKKTQIETSDMSKEFKNSLNQLNTEEILKKVSHSMLTRDAHFAALGILKARGVNVNDLPKVPDENSSIFNYKQKYKYYKREMLESLLVSDKKLHEAEILAIRTLIEEKSSHDLSNAPPEVIFDGGIKDKILIATRWHVVILLINFATTFIFQKYGFHWIDGLAYYAMSVAIGAVATLFIFIFFTKFAKKRLQSLHVQITLAMLILMFLSTWHSCRAGIC